MVCTRIMLVVTLMALTSTANAEVFYKNNPVAVVFGAKAQEKSEVDCQDGRSNGCQGTGKPTRFTAYGDCRVISTSNGHGLFIPARTKKEWGNFMGWAEQHPDIVTIDSCTDPQWGDWTVCASTCGKGTRTRQCNRQPKSDGSSGCKGVTSQECLDFSTCACGMLEKASVYCTGQDRNFTDVPPKTTYVDFEKCDQRIKCQARCPQGAVALPDGSGCSAQ